MELMKDFFGLLMLVPDETTSRLLLHSFSNRRDILHDPAFALGFLVLLLDSESFVGGDKQNANR